MMIAAMALSLLLNPAPAPQEPQPEPHTLYQQALGCIASADLMRQAGEGVAAELDAEILIWGMVMAQFGPAVGRTADEVSRTDVERAQTFFAQMKTTRPAVFAAHRAYCRAFLP